jgi:hypothetical protein
VRLAVIPSGAVEAAFYRWDAHGNEARWERVVLKPDVGAGAQR